MRLELFSQGDKVLLLGEGNFSFAKCLVNHNLPIQITATCLNTEMNYKNQLENVEFLKEKKIPVLFDVDATNLHSHPILKSQLFTKMVFNFPHVGGKMKIHLNRELVRKVFESSFHLLSNDGLLIISLCKGQGGTPADNPQRLWDDSWQITEMAAYGSFCLISVEPFDFNNFQTYSCTGYRSQDSYFNLKGALVHVFKKKITSFRAIDYSELPVQGLSSVPLSGVFKCHFVPFYYSYLYSKNPLKNPRSSVSFIQNLLLKQLEKLQLENNVKILNDEKISIAVESSYGAICECNGKYLRLRSSPIQIINNIFEEYMNRGLQEKIIFYPGMFFNSCLYDDFKKTSPISFQFVLFGENVMQCFKEFVTDLVTLFQTEEAKFSYRKIFVRNPSIDTDVLRVSECEKMIKQIETSVSNCELAAEWKYMDKTIAYELHFDYLEVKLQALILHVDLVIEIFFSSSNWKEAWSEESFVCFDSEKIPVMKQGILYPLSYTFDITLKYETDKGLSNEDVYETLRKSAPEIINSVELINEYISGLGWSSKCFRITYQSLNEPFNRSKALNVHTNLVSKMLTLSLPVSIK